MFVVPGYIGITFFKSVSRVKTAEQGTLISSCAYSFISYAIVQLIFKTCNIYIQALLSCSLCVLGAYVAAKLLQSKGTKEFLFKHLHYSPLAGPWEAVYSYEKGTRIRVRVKDGVEGENESYIVVVGVLEAFGDITNYPWIAISNYALYSDIDAKEPYFEIKDSFHHFMVNLPNVDWVELWDDER